MFFHANIIIFQRINSFFQKKNLVCYYRVGRGPYRMRPSYPGQNWEVAAIRVKPHAISLLRHSFPKNKIQDLLKIRDRAHHPCVLSPFPTCLG